MSDNSQFLTQVQNFLKSRPLGVSYSGPVNGELNSEMLSSLRSLENLLTLQSGEMVSIVRGNSISPSGFQVAISKLPKKETQEKKDSTQTEPQKKEPDSSKLILEFQKYFSSSHDLLPKLYSGPQNGKINSDLISSAQKAEEILSSLVNEPKIRGQIFSSKTNQFLTSPEDLQSAVELISKNKK